MERIKVLKTYKIYIGGQFPRTESGRYYEPKNSKNESLGNICLSSRKDVKNAVVAARKAQGNWSERSAFNRGQIIYRIAEMLEGRKAQFIEELTAQNLNAKDAEEEVNLAIDRLIYYAGWCDKYMQIESSVNPVASSHFNFSIPEPMGVIGVIPDSSTSLIGLVSIVAPIIAGGNTCVVLASEQLPLCAITFAEVLNSSDVPGGVVNILTGQLNEMIHPLGSHMDVNAVVYCGSDNTIVQSIRENSIENLKRVYQYNLDWTQNDAQFLHLITDLQEIKTTWHPIENIGGATSTY